MREISANTHQTRPPCEENPDLWFSELRRDKREARSGCAVCPQLLQCRDEAIERHLTKDGEHGIWGGLDREQRQALVDRSVPQTATLVASAA